MQDINLRILGTKEFIENTKKEIIEMINNKETADNIIKKTLPENYPEEMKNSVKRDIQKYL